MLVVEEIIKTCENHPSINLIRDNVLSVDKDFTIEIATVVEINKMIQHLNLKKANEPDKIPVKIIKLADNIMDSHLTNIINNYLSRNSFSDSTKVASARLISNKVL